MAKASRDKGVRGEREVCALFNAHGFDVNRVPNSGGLFIPGDITGLAGYHVEVKRQERLDIPAWITQAWKDAPIASLPIVAFRRDARNPNDPLGIWQGIVPLDTLASLLHIADTTGAAL